HTFDSTWHVGMGGGMGGTVSGPGTVRHRPDYIMINGREGANTLSDSSTAIAAGAGQKVLVRATNTGYQPALVRLGGIAFDVIASDGRPLAAPVTTTSQLVAPGERYDLLLTMPSSGQRTATVDYYDIRRGSILGSVNTSVTVM
ncbi:MAG: hypothetical protein JSU75_04630, partial [Gammaproteobacteria bacterium]